MIAIRPSDGDVKPGGPLGAFREEQNMSRHRVSPSPFLSSSSSHTTQLHSTNSHTYSHLNFNLLEYKIQKHVPHVSTAVGQAAARVPFTQRALVRTPVGTSFLGEVFSGFFLTYKTNVGKLQAPKVPEYHLAIIIITHHSLRALLT